MNDQQRARASLGRTPQRQDADRSGRLAAPPLSGTVELDVQGERLVLLPTRCVYWPTSRTLLVADTHWGKSAALRQAGIPLPGGSTASDLARLTDALRGTGARRLVILGDLLHARAGMQPSLSAQIEGWRMSQRDVALWLVRGNHDRRAGDPPATWRVEVVDEPYVEPPFVLRHTPDRDERGYVLAGHVHPCVQLQGYGGQYLQLPAFWFTPHVGILPAFSSLARGAHAAPAAEDRVFVIGDNAVIDVR